MKKPGLVAKKIKRRGGGLATYWIRPESDSVLNRLKNAKEQSLQQNISPALVSISPVPQASVKLRITPEQVRKNKGLPIVKPPSLQLSPVNLDLSQVSPSSAAGTTFRQNKERFLQLGKEINSSYVNSKEVRTMDAVPDQMMNLMLGKYTMGAFNPLRGDFIIRASLASQMVYSEVHRGPITENQKFATRVWTHEQLHSASNQSRPQAENAGADKSPNRWLEEATTELLSHYYETDVVKAITGKTIERSLPILQATGANGNLVLTTKTGVAYQNQSMRFVNLVAYMSGMRASDPSEEVNKVILGYASEVKSRGQDRFSFLAEEMMVAHGVKENHPKWRECHTQMTNAIQEFMGVAQPSEISSVESMVGSIINQVIPEPKPVYQNRARGRLNVRL